MLTYFFRQKSRAKREYLRKPYRIKKKKSIFSYRLFWLAVFVLVINGGIFYLICFSSFFQIKQIEITGNQKIPTHNIQEAVQNQVGRRVLFFPTKSIFLVNLEKINKVLLEEFPRIAGLSLKRNFPNILTVAIKEREPKAVFYQQGDRFFIDKQGMIFEKIINNKHQYLEIESSILAEELKLGKRILEKELLAQILEIEQRVEKKLNTQTVKALIVSDERLNIKILENWEIYFNLKNNVSDQVFNLGLVLDEKIPIEKRKNLEYIDLRFGSRVFFRYRD